MKTVEILQKWFGGTVFAGSNDQMIRDQIESRGVANSRVLEAMRAIDRAWFVPPSQTADTYSDCALPVGYQQTISQPYIVALMTELLDPQPKDRVLEVGCGTGYQTMILARLAGEVWSVEIIPELAMSARERLSGLGVTNARVILGNAWKGVAEHAPFQRIIVTAAPEEVPEALVRQLAPGGRMVIPVGVLEQDLLVLDKDAAGQVTRKNAGPVRFVPMVHGRAEKLDDFPDP